MTDKVKYQVFVSSTYTDLKNERKKILEILLMADCIPAGMENFVAQDDEQFNVIKKVIDLCDYYILIIGRRYGSVSPQTGISYTEMEYDYAIEKGVPVLVFSLDTNVESSLDESEDDVKKGKLAEFRARAMGNRLASVWKDQTDLMGKVAIAIMQAKSDINRPGWHRGSDEEKEFLTSQIKQLKEENDLLKQGKVDENDLNKDREMLKTSFYGVDIELHYTENVMIFTSETRIDRRTVKVPLDKLYKHISVRLTGRHSVKEFIKAVSSYQEGYNVYSQDAFVVKNKYEQLKLVQSTVDDNNNEYIELTNLGRKVMNELNQ